MAPDSAKSYREYGDPRICLTVLDGTTSCQNEGNNLRK